MTLFDDVILPTRPDEPTVRVRMVLAYNGAGFHGFAAQPGIVTVGGTLSATVARVLRVPDLELTCAGRTDRGVHAWGQVVTFDLPVSVLTRAGTDPRLRGADASSVEDLSGTHLDRLQSAVNKLCGPAIVVRETEIVPHTFDARFSATGRQYRYEVVNRSWPDPFRAGTAWHVAPPLELRSMQLACDALLGEHDFSSFCRRPQLIDGSSASLVRRVRSASWEDTGDGILQFWIEANAFCHQMVRSIVGTLVEVGRGKKRAGDLREIMAAGDRHAAGDLAPPQGLCLWSVTYAGERGVTAGDVSRTGPGS